MGLSEAESLIGTWRLLSREDRTRSGEPMLGPQPEALPIYDCAGNFAGNS